MREAHVSNRIFNGNEWLDNHAIITEGNIVISIVHHDDVDQSCQINHYNGMLVPGFVDLQIYGAGGKLFSQHLSIDSLDRLTEENHKNGTVFCLPTVATNSNDVIHKAIEVTRVFIESGKPGIGGLHLEGPWINREKKGAHLERFIKSPTLDEVKELLDYGSGVIKMITLAPEVLEDDVLQLLIESGVLISLGHSNANFNETTDSFSKGIKTVTHLFNAMSPLHHREPGIPAAVFNHASVCASIIPDGIHIDYEIIRLASAVMKERLFVITDAVTETNEGPYQHKKEGNKFVANGVLSGSALNMKSAVHNLIDHAGISLEEALKMCSLYPARLLRIDDQFGRIYKGGPARFVELENVESLS